LAKPGARFGYFRLLFVVHFGKLVESAPVAGELRITECEGAECSWAWKKTRVNGSVELLVLSPYGTAHQPRIIGQRVAVKVRWQR
jgi:hypothetical protein